VIYLYRSGTGQIVRVHGPADCGNDKPWQKLPCPIHHPSDHPLKAAPTHWRGDSHIMERICPHGVGHPDPDDMNVQLFEGKGVHGCCVARCCSGAGPVMVPEDDHDVR
jgi:hypothetical protein